MNVAEISWTSFRVLNIKYSHRSGRMDKYLLYKIELLYNEFFLSSRNYKRF